jgi:hypothetical protein
MYIKEIYCIFKFFFFSFGAKHRGFGCQNIDRAGSSASITSKSLNNKDHNVKPRNVCGPGNTANSLVKKDVNIRATKLAYSLVSCFTKNPHGFGVFVCCRCKEEGVSPPVARGVEDFDVGASTDVILNVPAKR